MKAHKITPAGRQIAGAVTVATLLLIQSTLFAAPAGRSSSSKGAERLMQHSQAPPRNALPLENDIPELAALSATYATLPLSTRVIQTDRAGNPLGVALHQVGTGKHNSVVILIHGVLANCETWKLMAGELGRDHDLWIIDLPGCGHSEKPDPKRIESDGYSPTAMADRIYQVLQVAIEERMSSGNFPSRVTISAHSLGGTVALRMLSAPALRARYANVLQHIGGAVLMAPCDFAVNSEMPLFMQVIELKGWQATVGEALGVVKIKLDKATRDGYHVPNRATRESSDLVRQILVDGPSRRATQAMLRQAIPWRVREHRPDWEGIAKLRKDYANIDVPIAIVWGEWDEALPSSMGYKLKAGIANATMEELPGCGHSLPSECPSEIAQKLRELVLAQSPKALTRDVAGTK